MNVRPLRSDENSTLSECVAAYMPIPEELGKSFDAFILRRGGSWAVLLDGAENPYMLLSDTENPLDGVIVPPDDIIATMEMEEVL